MTKCEYCGKEIFNNINKYNIRYKTKEKINGKIITHYSKRIKFCSKECKEKYSDEHKENKICPHCGKEFKLIKYLNKHINNCSLNSKNIKICPKCGKEHTKQGLYCSRKCANSKKHSEKTKKKIKESLKTYNRNINNFVVDDYKYKCLNCDKEFKPRRKNQRFCCLKCASGWFYNNSETGKQNRKELSNIIKNCVKEGKITPFKCTSDNISYPEKYFKQILDSLEIEHVHNLKVNTNSTSYFLDFAIIDKKIDLEIDGKYHDFENRKEHDNIRDKNLKSEGWIIYRIKWNSIKTNNGKELMKQKIDDFLKFLSYIYISNKI